MYELRKEDGSIIANGRLAWILNKIVEITKTKECKTPIFNEDNITGNTVVEIEGQYCEFKLFIVQIW